MILFSDDDEEVDLTKLGISDEKAQEASLAESVAEIKAEEKAVEKSAPAPRKSMLYDDVEEDTDKVASEKAASEKAASGDMMAKAAKKLSNVGKVSGIVGATGTAGKAAASKAAIKAAEVKPTEFRTEDQVRVDDMLDELDNIEAFLGMQSSFDDIKFPDPKPIFLPKPAPVQMPTPAPIVVSKADFAKLDDEQLEELMKKFDKVDTLCAEVEAMKNVLDERLNLDFVAMYENILEKNNIEAIKTYRNVQAVVVEEAAKQNRALFGIDGKSDSLKRRLNNVIIFSIVSFVVSILVMLMQILPALGIDLF